MKFVLLCFVVISVVYVGLLLCRFYLWGFIVVCGFSLGIVYFGGAGRSSSGRRGPGSVGAIMVWVMVIVSWAGLGSGGVGACLGSVTVY